MPKQIIIAEQYRTAAVFSEDQIEEIVVATGAHQVGDIYMGVVENILTSIDAAFVNIGEGERNGFIHISDLGPLRLKRSGNSINELLSPQQRVLVQIMKEPTGNKGPRLTGNISLPGRYVVLMPFDRGVKLSTRIRNENERNRLRALAILIKPSGMGLLIRTEAEGMSEESIVEDLENLQRQWELTQVEAASIRYPTLLDRDRDFIKRVLRDLYTSEVNRIVTDTADGLKRVKQHLLSWGEGKMPTGVFLDHHRERTPILEYFRVNAAIREALRPRVDLPSGGYIVIQPTEALTVIDVNSGSFTRSQTSRETVLWTNCEAATEIARQVRLRNIAGVIIVDFIDMDTRKDQMQLLEAFNKSLRADKARPQIAQLTELGLVELTRKRQGQSIYELFGCQCATCNGLGLLARLPGETAPQLAEPTPRHWEPRFVPEIDFDGEESDAVGLVGGSEPNLVNHPNYQERGGTRKRRRERPDPRSRENRSEVRSESRTEVRGDARSETRLEVRNEIRSDARSEARLEARTEPRVESRELTPRLSIVPAKANGTELTALPAAPEAQPERTNRREPPRPKEAPETIVVEMTPVEQQVYAHMGISPLVLVDREIKDPRNTIISVSLPGMAPRNVVPAIAVPTALEVATKTDMPPEFASESESVTPAASVPAIDTDTHEVHHDALNEEFSEERRDEPAIQSPMESRRRRRTTSVG